jgi:hypothetical protein
VLVQQFNMSDRPAKLALSLAAAIAAGLVLSGCAATAIDESTFFADPAKFAMYDCKQLVSARASAAKQVEELQGLMTKAETGPAGSIVSEVAYRADYLSAQARLKSANAAWERNRCDSEVQSADPSLAPLGTQPAGRSMGRGY